MSSATAHSLSSASSESSLPRFHHAPNPFTSFAHQFRSPLLTAFLGTSYSESADVGILCAVVFGVALLFALFFCVCRSGGNRAFLRSNNKPIAQPFDGNRNVYQQQQPPLQQHQPPQPYLQQQYTVDNQGRVVQGRPHLQFDWNARQQPPPVMAQHYQQHNPFNPQAPPVYYSQRYTQQHTIQPSYPPPYSSRSSTESLVPESCMPPHADSGISTYSSASNSATRPIPPPIQLPGGHQPYAVQQQQQQLADNTANPYRAMPNASAPSYRALPHVNTEKHLLQEMHPKPPLMPVAQPVNDVSARKYNPEYDHATKLDDDAGIERSTSYRHEPRSGSIRNKSELGVLYPGQRNHHGEEQARTLAK